MRRRHHTPAAPQGGPIIDEYGAQYQAAMDLCRREYEERMRAERDPKGNVQSSKVVEDSSDED